MNVLPSREPEMAVSNNFTGPVQAYVGGDGITGNAQSALTYFLNHYLVFYRR
ncbi:MAG: hypothetical protein R3C53_25320 [Pirellulaceae bacterium]